MPRFPPALAVALLLPACAKDEVALTTPTPTVGTSPSTTDAPECKKNVSSSCGTKAAVVQGRVQLGAGMSETTGDLFVALVHEAYNGSFGGGYHIHDTFPDVDLSQPFDFKLDMCDGGEMWSEDNCGYSLVVILDQNGNQSAGNLVPDPGEPATRLSGVWMSCQDDSGPCLDVTLDCDGGGTCTTFFDEPCACEPESCDSVAVICQ